MDVSTLRSLEWDRVLALLSVCASTTEGKNRAGAVTPEKTVEGVRALHARVTECREGEVLCGRLSLEGYARVPTSLPSAMAFPMETLRTMRSSLRAWRRAKEWLENEATAKPTLKALFPEPHGIEITLTLLEKILDDRGEVADNASKRLYSLRREHERVRGRAFARMETMVESIGGAILRETTYTVLNGRLVLPVKSSFKASVKGILHDTSSTGATTYIEPMEVVELNNRLRAFDGEEREEIKSILVLASKQISENSKALEAAFDFLETLDLDLAKARFGRACNGILPALAEAEELVIVAGRHPFLDASLNGLRAQAWDEPPREKAVPLDLKLSLDGTRTLVVSGPNAGGKSVALKTAGLLCAMQQAAIPIPASEGTRLPVFPCIHATVGDAQSILDSLSSFSARMEDLREALLTIEEPFLFILDELGSGTDPAEGAALGEAVLLTLHKKRGYTLCSTHFEALKARALVTDKMGNASMTFEEEKMAPTFRMQMGRVGSSHALSIAERSGLPASILETAMACLPEGEKRLREVLGALEGEIAAHERARSELRAETAKLEASTMKAEAAAGELEEEKSRFIDELPARLEVFRDRFIGELKAEVNRQSVRRVASGAIPAVAKEAVEQLGLHATPPPKAKLPAPGDWVAVRGMGVEGEVTTIDEGIGRVTLECGGKTLTVGAGDVEARDKPASNGAARRGGVETGLREAKWELNLIGQTVAEAEAAIEPFVDRAVMAGLGQVRIIHGIGTGRLRRAVREWSGLSPFVLSIEDAPPSGGGPGVTILTIEV